MAGVPVTRPQDHHTGTLIRSLPLRSGLSRVQRGTRSLLLSHTQHFPPLIALSVPRVPSSRVQPINKGYKVWTDQATLTGKQTADEAGSVPLLD